MTGTTPTATPLPEPDHTGRRARLAEQLRDLNVDALLVTAPSNVRYLCGFTGSNGQLLLVTDGAPLLLTDGRYEEQAARECPGVEVVLSRGWTKTAVELAVDAGVRRLGVEGEHITYAQGVTILWEAGQAGLTPESLTGQVEELRTVKDAHELAALQHACALTSAAFDAVLEDLRPGATEVAIARRLDRTMVDLGAEAPAFPTIVASGPNSAVPHHQPTPRAMQSGDLVKMDFGARVAGYHADMTRTVALGEPPARLREIHDTVRAAQAAGVAAAVAGATAGDVDAACRSHIDVAGYGDRFVHGTGHGVGLDIHEAPAVASHVRATLAARMALTVEPGVYLPGVGGVRIEDSVVIRADGPPNVLTTSPHELLVL